MIVGLLSMLLAAVPFGVAWLARTRLGRDHAAPRGLHAFVATAGALSGVGFALYAAPIIAELLADSSAWVPAGSFASTVVGPVAEEMGKGLVVLLVATRWIRNPAEGIVYGLTAGAGFAVAENHLFFLDAYVRGGNDAWAIVVSDRLLPSMIIHGVCTGLTGYAIGAAFRLSRPIVAVAALPAGFAWAVFLHGAWNATIQSDPVPAWVPYAALQLTALTLLGLAVRDFRRRRVTNPTPHHDPEMLPLRGRRAG